LIERRRAAGAVRADRGLPPRAGAPCAQLFGAYACAAARSQLCARCGRAPSATAAAPALGATVGARAAGGRDRPAGADVNSHWLPDNRCTLLKTGEAYCPRVFDAIAGAEHEALLETFILFDDAVGRGLQQALLRAAGRGATVHVMVDGWGSPDLPPSFTGPLLEAGVRLRSYEPAQRLLGSRVNMLRRMHRTLVVFDGRAAFVGGIS